MTFSAIYTPLFKTTDAELKGFENLSDSVKEKITPIVELTRSRKTKKLPEGSIHKRVNDVLEKYGDRPVILDLSTEPTLLNRETIDLFDEENGYDNWQLFLENIDLSHVTPTLNFIEGGDLQNLSIQAQALEKKYGTIAFRVDTSDDLAMSYIGAAVDSMDAPGNLLIVIDSSFIQQHKHRALAEVCAKRIEEIKSKFNIVNFIHIGSSFPSSVVAPGYGEDEYGAFVNEEVLLHECLVNDFGLPKVIYGDYSSIHPRRYQVRGGTWIPRVDIPLAEGFFYWRYRRDDNGYIAAAQKVVQDPRYKSISAWGDEQIFQASLGAPNGRSPSFWIAVRVNLHITQQLLRTQTQGLL